MPTTPPTPWTRKLAFLAIIWTVALVVLVLLAEVALRVTDDGWGRTIRLNIVRNRTYDFTVTGLYDNASPTVRYRRDAFGLRDNCGSPADIDILTVGGSTTDQRYLALDATFQAVMQRGLSQRIGRPICVSNAGIDGHSTYGHLLAFRDWFPLIPDLKPKLVVLYLGINDADFTRAGPNTAYETNGRSTFNRLRVVQFGHWIADTLGSVSRRNAFGHHGHTPVTPRRETYSDADMAADTPAQAARNAAAFRMRLRELLALAAKDGAEVVCVTQPHNLVRRIDGQAWGTPPNFGWDGTAYRYGGLDYDHALRAINQVIREECGPERVLDLYATPFGDRDFYDLVHTTPSGSAKIGQRLADFIANSAASAALKR